MHHVQVNKCTVTGCCFNADYKCHALAIQVGDRKPECDTFSQTANQCGLREYNAEVGACKVKECAYNTNLLCNAPSITVGWQENTAECITFKKR